MMNKFRSWLVRFMAGRRGTDQLGVATYIAGLALYIITMLFGLGLLSFLPLAIWGYGIFRQMSRNLPARERENQWFLSKYLPLKKRASQARVRFKNRRIYKYYRCPKCRSWLKLPRHIGEKKVTCSACGYQFTKKA